MKAAPALERGRRTDRGSLLVRLERLRVREIERYGEQAIAPGGEFHRAHLEFLEWAGSYDTGGLEVRSRALHEAWLATLPCAVVKLEGDLSFSEQLSRIETSLDTTAPRN